MKGTVLIVDDEEYVRDSLASVLRRRDFAVRTAAGVAEVFESGALAGADAVISDLRLAGEEGLGLIRELKAKEIDLPVLVLTGHGTVASAVECMRAGAYDYLLKPANADELVLVLDRALADAGMKRELAYLRTRSGPGAVDPRPLGVSPAWRQVLDTATLAAPFDTPVLLIGPSGTGKEVLARFVHATSHRSRGAFVSVNCAAIPGELFESEFFGHRRGSFTGAVADRDGRFRIAHRGTLFLDEINSLPMTAQAKVLRVLQDGTFERVGESQPTTVDVRLICASNADLEAEVAAGRFRADLFYRINVMTIPMPPLASRPEDLPVLARAFLAELSAKLGKNVREIAADALELLMAYHWPGNVRELRNVLERGLLLEQGRVLSASSLPFHLRQPSEAPRPPQPPASGNSFNLRSNLAAAEASLLEAALAAAGGVRREAARLLGIDERNLAYFLKKHGLMERKK